MTVTVCNDVTDAGAVYSPALEMLPTTGLRDQLTVEFDEPVTVAVKDCVCDANRFAVPGETVTLTGTRVTVD